MSRIEKIRDVVDRFKTGACSAKLAMTEIASLVEVEANRVAFIRKRYTTDPIGRQVFHIRTGRAVEGATVNAGLKNSPVSHDRALWFILKGTDPHMVGRSDGGLWAIMEKGGDRIYA